MCSVELSPPRGAELQKKLCTQANKIGPTWLGEGPSGRSIRAGSTPPALVFIDETWAKTNMTRRHGRCAKGRRLVAKVPHGRWRTLTFLAALRHDRIAAPCVIDGPIDGELPRLCRADPGADALARRNRDHGQSRIHKSDAVRQAIRKTGARLFFLPPYSPDLNPIEQAFAKLKTLLRKAAERTVEAAWRRSDPSSLNSHRQNAATISPMPDTLRSKPNAL